MPRKRVRRVEPGEQTYDTSMTGGPVKGSRYKPKRAGATGGSAKRRKKK